MLLWKKKGFNQFALAEAAKTLERAAKEGWPTSKIAEVLRVDIDEAQELSAPLTRRGKLWMRKTRLKCFGTPSVSQFKTPSAKDSMTRNY